MTGGPGPCADRVRCLAITGPTASGKTRLSLEVARVLDGEIISMDSRQVYRGMDVGTAKVTPSERARVAHHGLDLVDPDESYSAGRFARDARRWIREIRGRGRLPMLVGGTGFFLRAVRRPLFREPDLDDDRVELLRDFLDAMPRDRLEAWVRVLDPDRAPVAVEGGPQRLIRTLEVALLSGRPLTWWHEEAQLEGRPVSCHVVRLTLSREELDRRIRRRAERMIQEGLVEEVERLLGAGYDGEDPGLTGTGYREIVSVVDGELSLDEAVDRIEIRTRQYSRRQLTWFRNQLPEESVSVDAEAPLDEQVDHVLEAWRTRCRTTTSTNSVKGTT